MIRARLTLLLTLFTVLFLIRWGQSSSAQSNNRITQERFVVSSRIDGVKGQTITAVMTRVSGDLEPFLALQDSKGEIVKRSEDEDLTERQARLKYTFESDGQYQLAATRVGGEEGKTTGDFILALDKTGNAPKSTQTGPYLPLPNPSVIVYTSQTLEGVINNDTPGVYYLLRLDSGQKLNAVLTRQDGSLEPVLVLTKPFQPDDILERGIMDAAQAAAIDFTAKDSNWYLLVAMRADLDQGTTSGHYKLSINLSVSNRK